MSQGNYWEDLECGCMENYASTIGDPFRTILNQLEKGRMATEIL